MSVITIVECEMCTNNFRINRNVRPHEREVPAGWFTVFKGDPIGQEPWNFCSTDCLRPWLIGQDKAEREKQP